MFGLNNSKKPATDDATTKTKTRGEQLRDGDRELIAREGCRLSNDCFLLEFVKPTGEARGRYEIIGVRSDSLTVVAEHEQCDFGTARALYGAGNDDVNPDGYYSMHRTDGQRASLRRATKGMAAAADLAVAASRVAKHAMILGEGNASSAEHRIRLIEDFAWPMLKNLEAFEIERNHLARARFDAQRQRDARPAAEAAERAEADARKAAAASALREQSLADAAATKAAHAELAQLREEANQQWREAEARRLAAEQAEGDAWSAEQDRMKAAEEEGRLLAEAEQAARS